VSADLRRRHLRIGWWTLAIFLTLGLLLEAFHGWKARYYLDVSASSRRLMWTLAHAHGSLLGLVNIAFAFSTSHLPAGRRLVLASASLIAGTLLLPAGFFLGGAQIHAGDPGLGALLVPPGAVALIAAVVLTARAAGQR
jgi:hypothetical protein